MKKIIIFLTIGVIGTSSSFAQSIDTIRVGDVFFDMNKLELGTTHEVVYTSYQGNTRFGAMKMKTVQNVEIDGKKYLEFKHEWMSGNPDFKGGFYYLCEQNTLKPVLHIRTTQSQGKEAFVFDGGTIKAIDSVENNAVADFNLELKVPTYNWEIDIETYSLLPMKEGYKAVMNFYHPGATTPPKYYLLEVEKSEKIELPNGESIDCWVIYTNYGGTQPSRFWYTKKDQNFIKMEGQYGQVQIMKRRLF